MPSNNRSPKPKRNDSSSKESSSTGAPNKFKKKLGEVLKPEGAKKPHRSDEDAPKFRKSDGGSKRPSAAGGRSPRKFNRPDLRPEVPQNLRKPKPASLPTADIDPNKPIRLNRYIAHAGICSRREADELIATGLITVNGQIVTEVGTKVLPTDTVTYDGGRIRMEKTVYVLLNKPKDYITTADDPQGRKTVMALVKGAGRERIYPVGRLDRQTTGLLLFTNDGDLATRLSHPRHGIRKIYHVQADKNVQQEHLDAMLNGVELEDGPTKCDSVEYVGDGSDKKEVGLALHSGKNRVVRRLFEHFGYRVVKLDRVYYAGLTKKDLPRGRWRHLTEQEVALLRMQVGSGEK